MILQGTVRKGHGCGSKTLPAQFRHFVWFFSVLGDIKPGTLNVELDTPFKYERMDEFDHIQTRRIQWTTQYPPESFKFYPVKIAVEGSEVHVRGFIYESSLSPHRLEDGRLIELVAQPIEGVQPGSRVLIALDDADPGRYGNPFQKPSKWKQFVKRILNKKF